MILATKSGKIRLRQEWKNVFQPDSKWRSMPATIFVDAGHGNYSAWSFTGDMRDAAKVAASRYLSRGQVGILTEGRSVYLIDAPADFLTKNGKANTKRYPNIIAWKTTERVLA